MTFLEKINQFPGLKQFPVLYKTFKNPVYAGILLTLIIALTGGFFYGPKKREVVRLNEELNLTQLQAAQKEKNLSFLKEQVNKINLRIQRRALNIDHLTANERKMSQVLEKMALLAAGDTVEVISFRPDSRQEEEKEVLLTVRVKVKTRFNELEHYLSKLDHFPQPVKIDRIKIETLEDETPLIFAELLVTTRLKKEEG